MIAKKYDYIIIYIILFAPILSIAALVRLLVIEQAAQQKIQQEQAEVLESVFTYTVQGLALYLIFLLTP